MPILPGISDFLSMLVVGLEPTRGCPQQILSLPRLPFRHTSIPTTELYNIITAIGWQVISAKNTFYKKILFNSFEFFFETRALNLLFAAYSNSFPNISKQSSVAK